MLTETSFSGIQWWRLMNAPKSCLGKVCVVVVLAALKEMIRIDGAGVVLQLSTCTESNCVIEE